MSSTRKVAIGLGIAGGALLAAWLLTGTRKRRTKDFLTRAASDLKKSAQSKPTTPEDPDAFYV
jgi:hypothetical protein